MVGVDNTGRRSSGVDLNEDFVSRRIDCILSVAISVEIVRAKRSKESSTQSKPSSPEPIT